MRPGLAPLEPSADPADAWQVSRPRHEIKFVGPARAATLIVRYSRQRPISKYALCLEYARGGAT